MNLSPLQAFFVVGTSLVALATPSRAEAGVLSGGIVQSQLFHVKLTLQGTTDWAAWGYSGGGTSISLAPDVRKLGGSAISSLTNLTNGTQLRGIGQFGNYGESFFDWSSATLPGSVINAATGLQHYTDQADTGISGVGEGFSFTVPADTATQEVKLYFTSHLGISTITATLSDGSAADFSESFDAHGSSNLAGILTLDFAAGSAGQTLTIQGTLSSYGVDTTGLADFAIQAVTLAPVVPAPEPNSLILAGIAAAGLLLLAVERRRATANQSRK